MQTSGGVAVLASGGVESSVLLHHLADEGAPVHPVYLRQGFRWEREEVEALEHFLAAAPRPEFQPLSVLVMPLADLYAPEHFSRAGAVPHAGDAEENTCLPGRNVTFLAKAGVYAALNEIHVLALGPLATNRFPDASPAFFARTAEALSTGLDHRITIRTPFIGFTKPDVLLLGQGLPIELTMSCMDPAGGVHCGVCSKCGERREAFRAADLIDRTRYAQD
jgi:7-cyano-7-deazaguanine synthase